MREIPRDIEQRLVKLGLYYNERQAFFIYADGGVSPPDFVCERIARRIGEDGFLRAWSLVTDDKLVAESMQSNLRAAVLDNFPGTPPAAPATSTPVFRTRTSKRGRHTIAAMVGCVV